MQCSTKFYAANRKEIQQKQALLFFAYSQRALRLNLLMLKKSKLNDIEL
jgi:hypothetical protein